VVTPVIVPCFLAKFPLEAQTTWTTGRSSAFALHLVVNGLQVGSCIKVTLPGVRRHTAVIGTCACAHDEHRSDT
jgi:hypothetical protein